VVKMTGTRNGHRGSEARLGYVIYILSSLRWSILAGRFVIFSRD
jgi:hypothetical protein